MALRASRDWRGIKHHLGEYSTAELLGLLKNAEHTQQQVTVFAAEVAAELARREMYDSMAVLGTGAR